MVFSRMQKLRFVETRDSGEFSTRLDGLEAPQGVTKSSRNRPQSHAQRTKRENQNSSHKRHSKYKIDSNSKAPRAQGGEGLLSRSILVQSLKNPWMKFYPRERKREEQRRKRQAPGSCSRLGKNRREREREGCPLTKYLPLTLELKD